MPAESALAIAIPEAESLVESFRRQFDPSAATGIPAHVTILYPFKPPEEITGNVLSTLQELFSNFPSFNVSFMETRRFPGVLYLSPVPDEPFRKLSEIIASHFPETPPYGGDVTRVIPHLTIAQVSDPQRLDEIETNFQHVAMDKLPVQAAVRSVTLFETSSGNWQVRVQFPLRPEG